MGCGGCKAMKAWILVALTASVTLAGCGAKEDALAPYLMAPSETPDSCYYWQPEGDVALYMAGAGFEENPGSFDRQYMAFENITPVSNRVAFFECKLAEETGMIISLAGKFEDSRAATDWILAATDEANNFFQLGCNGMARIYVDGAVIGGIGSDSDHPAVKQAVDNAFTRILKETGAKEYCPT